MNGRLWLLGGVACALAVGPAQAREWIVTVGARASATPLYLGADHNVVRGSPTFSIAPAKAYHRFSPPGDGATFALIDTRRIAIGPMARFQRKRKDEDDLTGLREIDRAIEPGGFVDLWPTDWLRARVEVRRGIGGHKGWVGDGGLDLVYSGKRWDAAIGPRIGFGDDRFMGTYFGVTPREAALSPLFRTAYAPGGGRRYTGMQGGVAYQLDKRWQGGVDFSYQRLSAKAAASPIVRLVGDRDQYSAGVSLSYSFGFGH